MFKSRKLGVLRKKVKIKLSSVISDFVLPQPQAQTPPSDFANFLESSLTHRLMLQRCLLVYPYNRYLSCLTAIGPEEGPNLRKKSVGLSYEKR